MSTPPTPPEQAALDLGNILNKCLIGQAAAVEAFVAEISRHLALAPPLRRPGVFLICGPNLEGDHLLFPVGLALTGFSSAGVYSPAGADDRNVADLLASLTDHSKETSLRTQLKQNPRAVFVLQDIERVDPELLGQLKRSWSMGFAEDDNGEQVSLTDTIFILTTDVAQAQIGQIARSERDPDRLHIACLKALMDAGFPASLLRSINTAFGLQHLTPGELAHEHYRRLAEQVVSHGLVLDEGGVDARVLSHVMDVSPITYPENQIPSDDLDRRLAEARAQGARTVRLILVDDIIDVIPVGNPGVTEAASAPHATLASPSSDQQCTDG